MKKRLLITVSTSLSIKYIFRSELFEKLTTVVVPVVAIAWNDEIFVQELKDKGIEVFVIPETIRQKEYINIRHKIELWFNKKRLKSSSTAIQEKFLSKNRKLKNRAIRFFQKLKIHIASFLPGYSENILSKEKSLLITHTNFSELVSLIEKLDIDSVFSLTPFHNKEDMLLRACKYLNKKMITSIHSFDNITKYSWVPVTYDIYFVWNNYMKNQLHRIYPETLHIPVHVYGALQFDFYKKKEFIPSLEEWKNMMNLPLKKNKKIILYAGGSANLFPREMQYVKHICEAISNNSIKDKPILLVRCHPLDKAERWKSLISKYSFIHFDSPWTGTKKNKHLNITTEDVKRLCGTLAYTDIHINLCSTMALDGAFFNKPQIGPAYDDEMPDATKSLASMYHQEHYWPIIKNKAVFLAHSKQEFIDLINHSMTDNRRFIQNLDIALQDLITYTDGKTSERIFEQLKSELC